MLSQALLRLALRGLVPEVVLRAGVRAELVRREALLRARVPPDPQEFLRRRAEQEPHRGMHVADHMPADFAALLLGPTRLETCGWFDHDHGSLLRASRAMLRLTAQRADLRQDQRILDLGCGFGARTLHIAEHLPGARITALAATEEQRQDILRTADARGLPAPEVRVTDLDALKVGHEAYDRILLVEQISMRRDPVGTLRAAARALRPGGLLFVQTIAHHHADDMVRSEGHSPLVGNPLLGNAWMPGLDSLARLDFGLLPVQQWVVSGLHWVRTSRAIHRRGDQLAPQLSSLLGDPSGEAWQRWRLYFVTLQETFGFGHGETWMTQQTTWRKPA